MGRFRYYLPNAITLVGLVFAALAVQRAVEGQYRTAAWWDVKNGRIVVDESVDLPEGAEVSVYLYDAAADNLQPQERAALGRALERGLAQADAGDLIDADVVLAELERAAASAWTCTSTSTLSVA